MRQSRRRWWWALSLVPLVAALAFVLWASTAAEPLPGAIDALRSVGDVQVTDDRWLVFQPTATSPETGFILYPGGRVDPRAYAPTARELAAEGYTVVIVPMPLNLAVLGSSRGLEVMDSFPAVKHWAVGGHSLGGAMAAKLAFDHPDMVDGLVLWAAYPAASNDLSASQLPALSVYATLDGLASPDKIEASRRLVPPNTRWVAIEGGNHAQFGWYGEQPGDMPARISRESQQSQIILATLSFLAELS
jgi:hypothetical protein